MRSVSLLHRANVRPDESRDDASCTPVSRTAIARVTLGGRTVAIRNDLAPVARIRDVVDPALELGTGNAPLRPQVTALAGRLPAPPPEAAPARHAPKRSPAPYVWAALLARMPMRRALCPIVGIAVVCPSPGRCRAPTRSALAACRLGSRAPG